MKILLLGEYSNVHWTLSEGLRALGHEVTVISDGDNWKNYKRDINLRRSSMSALDSFIYLLKAERIIARCKGYDVVQIINPVFLNLKAERMLHFYKMLRRNNRSLFMGAFGMDYFWVKAGLDCTTFRYSDFNMGKTIRSSSYNDICISDWLKGAKGKLNTYIAQDCDGIISGLYEYDASYRPYFSEKLRFIPFPIKMETLPEVCERTDSRVRFFIGIQKTRSEYKGTDIMLRALERIEQDFPSDCEVVRAESIPFEQYKELMNASDVLLDQLYSYTPAMNALLAMAKGLVVVGGGEEENYEILSEKELRPIINVEPNEDSVYSQLKYLVMHKDVIPVLKQQSLEYISKHHDYKKVAQRYLKFWEERIITRH